MKIIVFDRDENRIADLNPEGINYPKVFEDKEGLMTFNFQYAVKEEDVSSLKGGNFVAFFDELDNVWKEYEITNTTETPQFMYIESRHRYEELATEEFVSWEVDGADSSPFYAMTYTLQRTRWKVGIVENMRQLKRSVFEKNPLEALRFIEREWGGVIRFRIELTGSGKHEFFVDLLERRGAFTGHRFEFGHNLQDFEHSVDFALVKTAMYGRGQGEAVATEEDTEALTFADVVWSVANGDPVDKPKGQTWVGFEDKRLEYGKPDGNGGRKHLFGRYDSQAETPDGLLWETYFKLQAASEPIVNVRAGVLDLERLSPEFSHETARLGDEAYLIARYEGRDISLLAEIIRTERNPDDPSDTFVELGNYLPVQSRQNAQIKKYVTLQQARAGIYERAGVITKNGKIPTGILEGVIDAIQNEFHSSVGFVYQTAEGILVLNDDKDRNPTKAMFITGGAFFLSNEKNPDGTWKWRTFGDGDGFIADEINAGTLNANLVNVINLNADNIVSGKVKAQFLEIGQETVFEEGYDPSAKLETIFDTKPPANKNVIWVDITDRNNPLWKVWDKGLQLWVLGPSGPRGPQGLEGIQGPQGDQGIRGPAGADGISSFTHIAYANSPDGRTGFSTTDSVNKAYIGMFVDTTPTDSENPSDYNWTLIKGADGKQGIQGPQGENGLTPYLHIAYATSADGSQGFSVIETNGKTFIGTYTDFEPDDSLDYTRYTWAKFQGPQGPQGIDGPQGPRGLDGLQGPEGKQGIQGPAGKDGVSSYTHIAYANSADGRTGFSTSDSVNKTYIGMYVDSEPLDSEEPTKYAWTLIKGADGARGIQGPAGEDGLTPYLHIAYAASADGRTGFNKVDPTGAKYIGTYTDFEVADSDDPTKYTWAKFEGPQGPQGPRGLQGLEGPEGKQGIEGKAGKDGTSSYTHIAYSTAADGSTGFSTGDSVGKTYIGIYVDSNPIDSEIPSKYAWTLIKGADGERGLEGKKGEDGLTPYFHIAYASSADGKTNFHLSDPNGRTYIGTYTDFTAADSTDPLKYSWAKFEGPKGTDGKTFYTWVKYADTATGGGMADIPDGKKYIGLAYNKNTAVESNTASDYAWSLIQGPEGPEGPAGDDGQTTYTWIKYADTATGTGISDSPTGKRFLGLAYNKNTDVKSNNPADYSWSPLYDNVKVGVRNLYKDSYLKRVIAYTNTTLTRTEGDGTEGIETNVIKCVPRTTTSALFGFHHEPNDRGLSIDLNEDYVLSFLARGNVTNFSYSYFMRNSAEGSNNGFGSNPVTLDTVAWKKIVLYKKGPWSTDTGYLLIGSTDVGTAVGQKWFEVAEVKFEKGTIDSDFSLNPEDIQQDTDKKLEDITTAYTTAISNNNESIMLEVGKKVSDSEGEMKKYTDGRVSLTEEDFNIRFGTIEEVQGEHGSKFTEVYSYFKFDPITGLNIGKSDSPLQVVVSNKELQFIDNKVKTAYINGQTMYITTAQILESIIVGNHKVEKYDDNLTLVRWVGV